MVLRVGFMGTPDFALAALKAIHDSAHEVVCVYSQPPRPKGRGHQVQPSPVHAFAQEQGIEVFTPETLKSTEEQEQFALQNLDVAVVAAYGLILPKAILEAPKYGCLNIHASLLPRWRGASPIQQAIWVGDEETGISIMQMDEGLDTGPVIAMESVELSDEVTTFSLHDELAILGGRMIVETLDQLVADGMLASEPQNEEGVTYAPLLKKEDGKIDWQQSAIEIDRQIRVLNPWPGVFCDYDGQRTKIKTAVPTIQKSLAEPGTILDREGHVVCGDGSVLHIQKIQPAGKQEMDFASAVNGNLFRVGERFS